MRAALVKHREIQCSVACAPIRRRRLSLFAHQVSVAICLPLNGCSCLWTSWSLTVLRLSRYSSASGSVLYGYDLFQTEDYIAMIEDTRKHCDDDDDDYETDHL